MEFENLLEKCERASEFTADHRRELRELLTSPALLSALGYIAQILENRNRLHQYNLETQEGITAARVSKAQVLGFRYLLETLCELSQPEKENDK